MKWNFEEKMQTKNKNETEKHLCSRTTTMNTNKISIFKLRLHYKVQNPFTIVLFRYHYGLLLFSFFPVAGQLDG